MKPYTRTHILSTLSSAADSSAISVLPDCDNLQRVVRILSESNFCCVVAIIATEPKTVFPVIPSHDNFMCSMQAKLPVFGRYLEGKMPASAIVLGASLIRSFAKSLQKWPT
jgi:hypothetical protein